MLEKDQILKRLNTCLNNRQFNPACMFGRWLFIMILAVSCGAKTPNKKMSSDFYLKQADLLLIEKQCQIGMKLSPLTKEVNELYMSMNKAKPLAFLFVPPKIYDFENPLKLSPQLIQNSFFEVKKLLNEFPEKDGAWADHLLHLYLNANRFDSLKCSLTSLIQKKQNDFRPLMELKKICKGLCHDQFLASLADDQQKLVEEKTVQLCRSFSKEVHCHAELALKKRNLQFPEMVRTYQERFRAQRYDRLFSLRPGHLRFQCYQEREDRAGEISDFTRMRIKVYQGKWDSVQLKLMLNHVSNQWSQSYFKLDFDIVEHSADGQGPVIHIIPTQGFTSFVPDKNNHIIYLSDKLDYLTRQKILAHEFGHVLGFPDCYVEFFDEKEQEVIYYEQLKSDTNIMCSVKNGVKAPDDYLRQLREKSCLFQQ